MTPTELMTTARMGEAFGLFAICAVGHLPVWWMVAIAAWAGVLLRLFWSVPLTWWHTRYEKALDPQTANVAGELRRMGHPDLAHPLTVERVCCAISITGYELAPQGTLAALLATTEECKVCGGRGFHEQDGRPVAGCDACDGHGRVANWVLVDRGAGRPWPEWRA